ncbi:PREDICTED: LEAF RUST 10 DISEASE-RESISTANCE LOCUS RECEPTOR-LIKE PROTEIN KINASE-like 2.5 [Camelina sativa]|uniref:non-specific serine/threonine protein kinase n=1 Tax=Camelina sativa TaxID=90675 RepID=A0ABM0SRV1_CAMSA|nr:PREDICTED: LEAF RUST 10 DISEASE-RESISTANCE LOCUS RECEPTOR-LIKE PROTEIN KINASE-like 2.5 [Camelina sativa]
MINLSLSLSKSIPYTLIWMLFVIPSYVFSAEQHHLLCSPSFSCGNQSGLLYPFWIPERKDCGHPDFELDCSGGFPELIISSMKFRILAANYTSGIIRLARSNYSGDPCSQDSLKISFNETVLPIAPTTDWLTVYYDCNQDFSASVSTYVKELDCGNDDSKNYYVTRNLVSSLLEGYSPVFIDFRRSCSINVNTPASRTALNTLESSPSRDNLNKAIEESFEVGVNLDCKKCRDSGGACGYNHTLSTSGFVCYCIIAAAVSISALALIVACVFLLIRRRRNTQEAQYTSKDYDVKKQNLMDLIPLKHYSYAQVQRITKSFAEVVGKGGFGTVYRGTLSDGRSVAVKILKDSKGNGEDFINEVASMSKTSHVNIVTLLGFCSESSKRAIIYEFLENGSLDKFISSKRSSNMDWKELYMIALGVARGLEYLHHGCRTRIVHFDIKPQNVLLDDNLSPKVSDFGLAKLCERTESILSLLEARGTIGYIAPEVFSSVYGRVSHKSDVYSYGMLVLEIIGARNRTPNEDPSSSTSSMYFPEWIYKDLEMGDNGGHMENGVSSEEDDKIAKKLTLVGLWCIQPWPSDRPAMNRVVEMLEGNLDALEVPPRPVLQCSVVPHFESSWISEENSISSH